MKNKLLSFCIITLTFLIFSHKTFAQVRDAGGSADGGSTPPDLTINLGSAVLNIPATSPYYSVVTSVLSYFHATITNGFVSFPTSSCYSGSLQCFYYSGCINYSTYKSCKTSPPTCGR